MSRTAAVTLPLGSWGTSAFRLPAVRLDHLWLAAPVVAATLIGGFMPAESIDLWWVLLLGGAPAGGPDPVVFSPVTGPAANPQWLAQRAFSNLYQFGGLGLLLATRAGILGLTMAIQLAAALRFGASPRQAGVVAWLVLPIVLAGGALRPQLFALPLFAAIVLLAGPLAGRRSSRVVVGLVVALWANVHGSFLLAPLVIGALAFGAPRPLSAERVRLLLISLVAPLLNPWGVQLYSAVLEVTRHNGAGAASLGLEWRPLDLRSPVGAFFIFTLIPALAGVRRVPDGQRSGLFLLLAGLAALALAGGRHSTWFAMAALTPAAFALAPLRGRSFGRRGLNALLLVALMGLGLVGPTNAVVNAGRLVAPETPVDLADRLAALEARRVFAFSDWGGYLAWRTRPAVRLYVDNRFEQHPPEVWTTYRAVSLAEPAWEDTLDALEVDALAVEPRIQARLVQALAGSARWKPVHTDERGILYVRR